MTLSFFLILSIIVKNKKILYVGSFNFFSFTIPMGSNWYMNTGVRDFKLNLLGLILPDLMTYVANRPIYAVLNTHNLGMILHST